MPNTARHKSSPLLVCFLEQNPISLDYLTKLLRGHEFKVVGQEDAYKQQTSSPGGRLVLVVDEKILAPGSRLSLRLLRTRFPEAKLLVLATAPPRDEQWPLLLGTDGLVLYSEARQKLLPALRALGDGHLWFPPQVLERLAQLGIKPQNEARPLTRRETEIIPLVGEGLSNKEIATKLGTTEKTVKFHLCNVFAKLGVHDRYSAIDALDTACAFSKLDSPRMQRSTKCP